MELNRKLIVAIPLILLAVATTSIETNQVKAWDSGGDCGWSGGCGYYHFHHWGCGFDGCNHFIGGGDCGFSCGCGDDCGVGIGEQQGCGSCGDGYQAGVSDAVYDVQNNLAYQPYGSCLPCHSQDYWSNFHQGYDHYWNSHQQQESTQGTSININGNNNYVNTAQYNNQQQNPLQQIAHLACGFVNCNGQGPGDYGP